jgi:FkbM family methyltransferase
MLRRIARGRHIRKLVLDEYPAIVVDNGDHLLAISVDDKIIGAEVLRKGHWFRDEFDALVSGLAAKGHLKPSGSFLDVGANIGTQTVYAMLTGFFRKAIAIEPYPWNATLLRMNMALNQLTDRVAVVESAAGPSHGSLALSVHPTNGGAHTFVRDLGDTETIQVDVKPVDAILREVGSQPDDVGLVWVDVESFEPGAIAGMASVLPFHPPLCVEFNVGDYGSKGTADFLRNLAQFYEKVALLDSRRDLNFMPINNFKPTSTVDVVFV